MRIKLDENLPGNLLLPALQSLGHDVDTVAAEGLNGASDGVISAATKLEDRLPITQDLDFSDLRAARTGVILLRLHNPSRLAMARRVAELFRSDDPLRWPGKLVVVTETNVRVRELRY